MISKRTVTARRPPGGRSMSSSIRGMRSWVRELALCVAIPVVCLAGCETEAPPEAPVRPVISMVVLDVEAFRKDTYPGRAKATQEVNLAFEVSGQLLEGLVAVGDTVKQEDVLARLDPRDFENVLIAATAERERAKAHYERVENAAKTGAVAGQTVTNAKAVFEAAEARVGIAEKAVNDTKMVAPFAGTVAATYVENFQNVIAKQRILRLLDTSQIEMEVSVPEDLIGLEPYVTDLRVRFNSLPDVDISARVKEISNEASITTRTYPVTIVMDQPEGAEIKPGMAGEATVTVKLPEDWAQRGIEVPLSALFSPDDAKTSEVFVWIVNEGDSTVTSRQVQSMGMGNRGMLIQGVKPGDRIVTAGVSYLSEGQKVRVQAK